MKFLHVNIQLLRKNPARTGAPDPFSWPSLFHVFSIAIVTCFFMTAQTNAEEIKAPNIAAMDQDKNPWSLKDHLGTKPIVIYFYPAAMTGGCTKQACSYRDYAASTSDPEFIIVGISGDTPENLKHFQQAENLNFPLLSDPDGSIAKAFGVTVREGEKSIKRTIDGKEVELIRGVTASRWTFVISPAGKIIYKNDQVKATEDLKVVLEFLNQK